MLRKLFIKGGQGKCVIRIVHSNLIHLGKHIGYKDSGYSARGYLDFKIQNPTQLLTFSLEILRN